MKVLSVTGITKSGKTTTIENIIRELVHRGYSVGTVKEIHNEAFAIDSEGKNTYRHRQAGAKTVTALGLYETDVMYQGKMNIYQLLRHYSEDYVILEGVDYANVPRIATAHDIDTLVIDDLTFIISGVIANEYSSDIEQIPVISSIDNICGLVDRIEELVPKLMPDMDKDCCNQCGSTCRELVKSIIKGKAKVTDCKISNSKVKLNIDGQDVEIVPFVDNILYNSIIGIVGELRGYRKGADIVIKL